MSKPKRICVYCASSMKVPEKYFIDTKLIATQLANHGHHIVYGGGAVGLMGALADSIIEAGGSITGVMPNFMKDVEWNHPDVSDMVYTETMAERKEKLIEYVDVALALPGGSGTYEEIMEAITLKRLGQISARIIFYNQDGFYDHMKAMFDRAVQDNFMTKDHLSFITFESYIEGLLDTINAASEDELVDIQTAVVR